MAFTTCSVDTSVIASLGTTPEERGLTTEQFKAKFDQAVTEFVEWFNETHIAEANAHLADKANPHGVTASQVGAITKDYTDGFGLGTVTPRDSDDLDQEISNGWVNFYSGTASKPSDQSGLSFPSSGVVRVDRRTSTRVAQTAYGLHGTSDIRKAIRVLGDSGWSPWYVDWNNNSVKASVGGSAGYQVFPNGVVMQWGSKQVASGETITFPIAFPNAIRQVLINGVGPELMRVSVNYSPEDKTHFTVNHDFGGSRTMRYMAIGD